MFNRCFQCISGQIILLDHYRYDILAICGEIEEKADPAGVCNRKSDIETLRHFSHLPYTWFTVKVRYFEVKAIDGLKSLVYNHRLFTSATSNECLLLARLTLGRQVEPEV